MSHPRFTSALESLQMFEPIQKWGMVIPAQCPCTVSTGLYRFEHPGRASTLVALAGRERIMLQDSLPGAFEATSPRFTCALAFPLSGPEDPQER